MRDIALRDTVSTSHDDAKDSPEKQPSETAKQPSEPVAKTLFRQQAVEHVMVRQYGTVILTRPVSHAVLTGVFVTLALLLIAFFAFFETTRKAHIQGMLAPAAGVTRVYSNQAGVIREVRIKEGQQVREGDILFVVSSERGSADPRSTEALISELLVRRRDSFRTELQQAKVQAGHRRTALQQRAKDLEGEIQRLDNQALMQKQRISLSEQTVARFAQLKATNYISAAQLQEREAELLDQRQRLLEIDRVRSATRRDLTATRAEEQDIAVQALRDENALRRNATTLEQDLTENEARREIPIRAHLSGTITAITANLGQTVGGATSLASILPDGSKLEAEMYVPSHAVGFIKPGMTALLRYQAFPYQKFGQHPARVREVATTSVRPDELPTSAAALPGASQSEPVYRIRLELDKQTVQAYGAPMPLRSGMLVDASVLLERRKLYEWVLEPLFSISGRL
ncbi:HlyD family secretion protein [Massilia sp. ZL223]|uniref:HlyD family secretion protein n=1 Tax=Massilia sp. ZL223 TaxID=2824904 RepID=UPI001E57FD2E|nr:HlyD family efflux transporter periplasmic adaptor subunit [Massilia sp. ZL223]